MPARALLVLLVMLNIGAALWWLLRPDPVPQASWTQPDGVPRLQLLGEQAAMGAGTAAGPEAAIAPDAPADDDSGEHAEPAALAADAGGDRPPADASTQRCFSFGPYGSTNVVAAARQALLPLGAAHARVREVAEAPRGWQVTIAPQADRATADALAARIRAAGFDDLLVLTKGENANGIALGRYSSEAGARRHASALNDAGFPARAQTLGVAETRHWLDVAAGNDFDAEAARRTAGASQVRDIDCAGIVAAGPSR